jgi:hypothetical protein
VKIIKKLILQITLIISMFFLTVLPSFAESFSKAKESSIQPCWTEISQFNNSFNITSSGRADIESTLYAFSVDLISVKTNLQQFKNGSWTTIKTWTGTSEDAICSVVGSWYVLKGYAYRMVSTGTVYIGGQQVEKVDYKSSIIWYN